MERIARADGGAIDLQAITKRRPFDDRGGAGADAWPDSMTGGDHAVRRLPDIGQHGAAGGIDADLMGDRAVALDLSDAFAKALLGDQGGIGDRYRDACSRAGAELVGDAVDVAEHLIGCVKKRIFREVIALLRIGIIDDIDGIAALACALDRRRRPLRPRCRWR